jgi:hypothetical protein
LLAMSFRYQASSVSGFAIVAKCSKAFVQAGGRPQPTSLFRPRLTTTVSYADRLRRFASAQGIAVKYSEEIAPARGTSYGGRIALLLGPSAAEGFVRPV